MNFKNKGKVYFLSALIAVGAAIGGYFVYKNLPKMSVSQGEDVRSKDLSHCTINDESVLRSLFFNSDTVWPDSSKLPENVDPKNILEDAKYPGMGIKKLHEQGITGKDVHVAIIDQGMGKSLEHPEYKDAIVEFKSFFPEEIIKSENYFGTSFHGPAMSGLLAGKNTGTAPEVKLHYIEVPMGNMADAKYFADAMDYIIEKNNTLDEKDKIRIVSVSSAPSATQGNTMPNGELWEQAYNRARESGILVFDTKDNFQSCYLDYTDKDNISKCFLREDTIKGLKENESSFVTVKRKINSIYDLLCVPCGARTSAESKNPGEYSYYYQYPSESAGIPTLCGIIAMGLQVNPNVSNDEIMKVLNDTAYINKQGFKIVNPEKFVSTLKNSKT